MINNANLITVSELSVRIRIKPKTIYDWVATERIPYRKVGSRVLFCPVDIEKWLNTLQKGLRLEENIAGKPLSVMKG